MPNSSNTPTHLKRNTRSNSQHDLTLDNIKILIENSKAEVIDSLKKIVRDELKSLKEDISVLSSRVDKLENDNRLLFRGYEDLSKQAKAHQALDDGQIEEVVREIEQRYLRRENVIIRGLPEPESGSPAQRNAADIEHIHDIFSAMGLDKTMFKEANRLGRITHDRPRLLKVRCSDIESQREVLRRSRSLKDTDGYKSVYINKDLTVNEQKRYGLLRAELVRRRNDGEAVGIRNGRVVNLGAEDGMVSNYRKNFRQ
jgi:hypothetical protein